MKQWARGPLVSTSVVADVRNLIVEDWTSWGVRFEKHLERQPAALALHARPASPVARRQPRRRRAADPRAARSSPPATSTTGSRPNGPDGKATAPIDAPAVTTLPVGEMEGVVRARAGCLPRDAVDAKYIATTTGWKVGAETALR